jgi:hypothetical protein
MSLHLRMNLARVLTIAPDVRASVGHRDGRRLLRGTDAPGCSQLAVQRLGPGWSFRVPERAAGHRR